MRISFQNLTGLCSIARLLPFASLPISRDNAVPPLDELIDITSRRLRKLEETTLSDLDDEDEDVAANRYPSPDEDDEED